MGLNKLQSVSGDVITLLLPSTSVSCSQCYTPISPIQKSGKWLTTWEESLPQYFKIASVPVRKFLLLGSVLECEYIWRVKERQASKGVRKALDIEKSVVLKKATLHQMTDIISLISICNGLSNNYQYLEILYVL